MGGAARYYVILVVDVEGFGRRTDPMQVWLRQRLYEVIRRAVSESGLDFGALPPEDRGDGMFWLLPGTVPKAALCGRFLDRLQDGLRDHGRQASSEAVLRLRVTFHAGEVTRDEHGWAGTDLNTACRLVELPALRDTLASARRGVLAVAVSEIWYGSVIRHGYAEVEPDAYRQVDFRSKEVKSTAWVRVPGYDAPPGITAVDEDSGDAGFDDPSPKGDSVRRQASAPARHVAAHGARSVAIGGDNHGTISTGDDAVVGPG